MKRSGFGLTEVLLAVVLTGTTLVVILGVHNAGMRLVDHADDAVMRESLLGSTMAILEGETLPRLRELTEEASLLEILIEDNFLAGHPSSARERVMEDLSPVHLDLTTDVGGLEGLHRLQLTFGSGDGPTRHARILIRRPRRSHPTSGPEGGLPRGGGGL